MSTKSAPAAATSSTIVPLDLPQRALDGLFDLVQGLRADMGDAMRGADEGLAPMHLRMLGHVLSHPGASQQTLVQSSGRDKGQIARLVKELDARGLLVREEDPDDGRSHRLRVTPAGRAACQRFMQHRFTLAQRVFGSMVPTELQAFVEQVDRLRATLRPAGAEASLNRGRGRRGQPGV